MKKHLSKIWATQMRYYWSTVRHSKSPKRLSTEQAQKYKSLIPRTASQIQKTAQEIYSRFEYTNDNWDRLYDSIDTPASCVLRTFETPPLRDDCDGFHSALYWFVSQTFNTRLLTVVTDNIHDSHSLLICQANQNYFYIDYTYTSPSYPTVSHCVEHINQRRYVSKNTAIMYYELSLYTGFRWISKIF